jgi:hypothetical protein
MPAMTDNESEGSEDRELFEHLVDQFGLHGEEAVSFLKTAQWLLATDPAGHAPRQAGAVAYCVREALDRLLPPELGRPRWQELSAEVVAAKRRFEAARGLPGTDEAGALDELLAAIGELEEFKDNDQGKYARRLAGLLEARTGVPPLRGALRNYQQLLNELNSAAVHRSASLEQVHELLGRALNLLWMVFAPFQLRRPELDALALLPHPGEDDVQRLLDRCSTPHHLSYFMQHVVAPEWLFLLMPHGVLALPAPGAPWPASLAIQRLSQSHPQKVARWLEQAYKQWGGSEAGAGYVATLARDCLPTASTTLLRALRAYPRSEWIRAQALHALEVIDPSDSFGEAAARVFLNPDDEPALPSLAKRPIEVLVEGMNHDNANTRITLLARTLAAGVESHYLLFTVMPSGSIADVGDNEGREIGVLLRDVMAAVRRARELGLPMDRVLALLEPVQSELRARLRAWALSEATDIPPEALITEVANAIGDRDPTGDDVRLIQRVVEQVSSDAYVDSWRGAIGVPPTTEEVGRALSSEEVPPTWRQAVRWYPLLPEVVREAWDMAVTLMSAVISAPDRETYLEPPVDMQFGWAQSPITRSELEHLDVEEAARRVSSWRPSGDHLVIARELARTLEDLVASDPVPWASRPLPILALLRHATYVNHYFEGLAKTTGDLSGLGPELVEAVVFAHTHPWKPERLGDDDFDYDPTWAPADQAGVHLIGRLAERNVDLGDRYDDAWRVVVEAVRNRSAGSGISAREDPLETAINRPSTKALEATFHLVATEFRRSSMVREEFLELLDEALGLDGWDGAEHRAIIAPRLGFLLHVAPEWVESRDTRLFGDEAPDDLGQRTVELALKWGRPNRWLYERHDRDIFKAVRDGWTNALHQALVAMLWGVPGYSAEKILGKLTEMDASVVSNAGEFLARLLRQDSDPEHLNRGVRFWEQALRTKKLPSEAFRGFGWWAEVEDLAEAHWERLTLQTSERAKGSLDWAVKVAERCIRHPITTPGLKIITSLLSGRHDPWELPQIAEVALRALRASGDDSTLSSARERLRTALTDLGYFGATDM